MNPLFELFAAFMLGMVGTAAGAWAGARALRARFAVLQAVAQAKEEAGGDLHPASGDVPPWMQQAIRAELARVSGQLAAHSREQLFEQRRWQAEQDGRRRAEWQVLLSSLSLRPVPAFPPVPPTAAAAPSHTPMPAPPPWSAEVSSPLRPQSVSMDGPESIERELSDEEVDALPPDLPAPVPRQRKKMTAPKNPVLRNI